MNFDQNDPRFSAYILNELDAKDRAELEQQIAANSDLAAFIENLKKTGATLTVELQAEARDMSLSAAQRAKILNPHAANSETLWQKINSWLASPKIILTASAITSVLLVALALSVFFKQPLQPLPADQLPKADMVAAGFEQPSKPMVSSLSVAPSPPEILPEPIPADTESDASFTAAMMGSFVISSGVSATPTFAVSAPPAAAPGRDSFSGATVIKSKDGGTLGIVNYGGDTTSVANASATPATKLSPNSEFRSDLVFEEERSAFKTKNGQFRNETANNESYLQKPENNWLLAAQEPLSTFSIDVDTASYSNIRRFLSQGQLPPADAVRIEELLNYFTYSYPPDEGTFAVTTEVATCPWDEQHRLLRIGIKGKDIPASERPQLSLVFLIDVSGSMGDANKLPLVISGMKLLVQKLRPDDRVAIVTYAGESRLALASTPVSEKETILGAIEALRAGGSTNGEGGIKKAYQVARDNFIKEGANRVILCTDGDFNVGNTGEESLAAMVQRQARSGVFLNVYGFGMGNYKDSRLVQLADRGNGIYGYIDSYAEAQKIFSKQTLGTLVTIAKDVKIQVDFNPAKVGAYRLVGYEKRLLNKEDFKDDKKDAGEIGSGHSVTALYEIAPPGAAIGNRVEPSKYTKAVKAVKEIFSGDADSNELGTVRIRYKQPQENESTQFNVAVSDRVLDYRKASVDFKFAAAVAAFGMTLKDSLDRGDADLSLALQLAKMGKGEDPDNYRAEFIRLIETAKELKRD